jgi:PTH1 family peptidyl-tRNA hydrolase
MSPAEAEIGIEAVFGLGNPGPRYEDTRHNAGFLVVDRLLARFGAALQQRKFRAGWTTVRVGGGKVILAKPTTYMNRSGEAVQEIAAYHSIPGSAVLVLHDDLDLECGRIKVVRQGGPGGHRGVDSIIRHLGRKDFARVKLGIGRPRYGETVEAFVLEKPYSDQRLVFADMIEMAADVVEAVLLRGVDVAMNEFNRRET